MDLFSIAIVCAIVVGVLFYGEQRSSHHGIAELPTALVTLGFTLRLAAAVLTLTIVALSVGAL